MTNRIEEFEIKSANETLEYLEFIKNLLEEGDKNERDKI